MGELYSKLPHENHQNLIDGKKLTPVEFEAFKRKIQNEKREIELKFGIILILLIGAGTLILYYLIT